MKTNPVKQELRAGQPTFGTWLSLGEVHSAPALAPYGFELLLTLFASLGMSWKSISCPGVVN